MRYTAAHVRRVIEIATQAARARQNGQSNITLGSGASAQRLDLNRGGYCARFVRQVHEIACGLSDGGWEYAAGTATDMCDRLRAGGRQVDPATMRPGDILGINRNSGTYGHIAIYVGDGQIAENTSSATRGNPRSPGTKLTPLADVADRVTGCYRLAEAYVIVQRESGEVLTRRGEIRGDELWVPAREVLEAMGVERITDHLRDEGKVYVG
ncbi:MAG: hypothetical protein GYA36_21170 [Veillonellaceae bacterium]|nr:hypothetical protein [Veillonellaceae bacterium]